MGLLDAIYSGSDRIKRNVKGLLSDPVGYLEQVGGMLSDDRKTQSEANKRMVHDPLNAPASDYAQTIGGLLNFAPLGMTVWHGSPHKFTKFDMSKIGTGEGAQAYGHGLYMAEAPEVAQTYQKQISGDGFLVGDKVFDPWQLKHMNLRSMTARGDLDGAIAKAKKISVSDSPVADKAAHDLVILEDIKAKGGLKENQGALYKVDIPDEAVARFLDWDKPLSQQAPEVQKAFSDAGIGAGKTAQDIIDVFIAQGYQVDDAMRKFAQESAYENLGKHAYEQLAQKLGNRVKASDLMRTQGVQGIRYLDGGSRSAGQGSSNFVLFSDDLPRILEINGQATGNVPWKPGEWRGLLSP